MTAGKPRNVTMNDVARHAGVSRTTVSFVLGNRPDANIPEETRDRIHGAVNDLGYRPNANARSLASRQTHLFGLVTDIATSPFAGDVIRGAQDEAWRTAKLLMIISSEGNSTLEAAAFEMMLERRVEGLLYATAWHHSVTLPPIVSEVPTVLVNCFDRDGVIPSFVPDEIQGGYTATKRLLAAGHHRIAFINLDPTIPAGIGRRAGYQKALREAGLAVDEALVCGRGAGAEDGYVGANEILDVTDRPTGIFCATDRIAMGAYDAVKERGLRIPEDIAIVGFDNQDVIANHLRPRLTTVALPFEEMGSAAIGQLASIVAGGAVVSGSQLVACPLVERFSV